MNTHAFIAFNIGTLFNIFIVWKLYRSPLWRYAGIYRFFSLEALMLLCLFNLPFLVQATNQLKGIAALLILVAALLLFLATVISSRLSLNPALQFPTRGIYAHLRHPIDGAIFWFGVGMFIVHIDAATVVLVALHILALIETIRQKEDIMISLFGGDYAVYAGKTKKIIPFLY